MEKNEPMDKRLDIDVFATILDKVPLELLLSMAEDSIKEYNLSEKEEKHKQKLGSILMMAVTKLVPKGTDMMRETFKKKQESEITANT